VKGATQQKNPTVKFNIQNTKGGNTAMKCQVKTTDNSVVQRFPTCAPWSPKGSACTSQGLRGRSRKI